MSNTNKDGDRIDPRRFEYKTRDSYKFWTIELDGDAHTIRFGPIGSRGQERITDYESTEEALAQYQRRVNSKLRAGYQEVIKKPREQKSIEQFQREWEPHLPFLKAIAKDVFDVDNYLVYADWLTELQSPLGEFIQTQVALADPIIELYQRPELERKASLLQSNDCRNWFRELDSFLILAGSASRDVASHEFHLGLLTELQITTLSFALADALRTSPYCMLLTRMAIANIEEFALDTDDRSRHDTALNRLIDVQLHNLRYLSIGNPPEPFLRTNAVHLSEIIANAPQLKAVDICVNSFDLETVVNKHVPNVTSWHHHNMNDGELEILLNSPLVRQLEMLGLPDNTLTDEGGMMLADCKYFHSLSSLIMSVDTLSSEVRHAIYSSGLPVVMDAF